MTTLIAVSQNEIKWLSMRRIQRLCFKHHWQMRPVFARLFTPGFRFTTPGAIDILPFQGILLKVFY